MNKNPQKKRRAIIITAFSVGFLLLASVPTALFIDFKIGNPVYKETYYGAFLPRYNRLIESKKKKVVVIGTSSVAFGLNGELLEKELGHAGFDVDVIPYGLYGVLGTRLMLETSLPYIYKGDTVILSPELFSQTLTNYFSVTETYRAIENDTRIFSSLTGEETTQMILGVPAYLSERHKVESEGGISGIEGVYAASSFNDRCDMVYPRPENVMTNYYDTNNPIKLDISLFDKDFVDYLNGFYKTIKDRGASMYYRFCPMDELGMEDDYKGKIDGFVTKVDDLLDFPILGNPRDSVMKENWFYDSSFHLNTPGSEKNTLTLATQIKLEWGSLTKNITPEPTMPDLPAIIDVEVFGDDTDADRFIYTLNDKEYRITSVKEGEKERSSLIVPTHFEGVYITSIDGASFQGCANLRKVSIQENIKLFPDGLFSSSPDLEEIHLTHRVPSKAQVGWDFLNGCPNAKIYVPKASLNAFKNDYFWGHYATRIVGE